MLPDELTLTHPDRPHHPPAAPGPGRFVGTVAEPSHQRDHKRRAREEQGEESQARPVSDYQNNDAS